MLTVLPLHEFNVKNNSIPIREYVPNRLHSIFSYLIPNSVNPQNRSHIIFLFWPDTNQKQFLTWLCNILQQLRRIFPFPDSPITVDLQNFREGTSLAGKTTQCFDL